MPSFSPGYWVCVCVCLRSSCFPSNTFLIVRPSQPWPCFQAAPTIYWHFYLSELNSGILCFHLSKENLTPTRIQIFPVHINKTDLWPQNAWGLLTTKRQAVLKRMPTEYLPVGLVLTLYTWSYIRACGLKVQFPWSPHSIYFRCFYLCFWPWDMNQSAHPLHLFNLFGCLTGLRAMHLLTLGTDDARHRGRCGKRAELPCPPWNSHMLS